MKSPQPNDDASAHETTDVRAHKFSVTDRCKVRQEGNRVGQLPENTPDAPIQRFRRQMVAMTNFANFFVTLGTAVPPVFTLIKPRELSGAQQERWSASVHACIDFVCAIHPTKSLYVDPPAPIHVDPDCPPLDFSRQIYERLGKNHPFFDFIHAPFTRPLGTQFSLILITYCWDAYTTFISSVISICYSGDPNLSSDEKLRTIGLLPSDEDIAASCPPPPNGIPRVTAGQVPVILRAAKQLRSSFSHYGGDPLDEVKTLIRRGHFDERLMRVWPDGEFEVALPMARIISDVIVEKVEAIQTRARKL